MYRQAQSDPLRAWLNCAVLRVRLAHEQRVERLRDDRGATIAEYGVLLMLVALASVAALFIFGQAVLDLFTDAENEFSTINNPAAP